MHQPAWCHGEKLSPPDRPFHMHTRRHVADRSMLPALRISGFTLIEMAFVIVIASTLLLIGVKTLTALMNSSATRATSERMTVVKDALHAYASRTGRLPCPDTGIAPDGVGFDGFGSTSCFASEWGVLPHIELDIARTDASDGWGNRFLYQVTPAWATVTGVIGSMTDTFLATNALGGNIQILEKSAAGVTIGTISNVVAVIVSAGPNGLGAFSNKSTAITGATSFRAGAPPGADELDNTRLGADPSALRFVARASTESTAAAGGAFDDVVGYITSTSLAVKLIESSAFKYEVSKLEQCYREFASALNCATPSTTVVPPTCALPTFANSGTSTATVTFLTSIGASTPIGTSLFRIKAASTASGGTYTFTLGKIRETIPGKCP